MAEWCARRGGGGAVSEVFQNWVKMSASLIIFCLSWKFSPGFILAQVADQSYITLSADQKRETVIHL